MTARVIKLGETREVKELGSVGGKYYPVIGNSDAILVIEGEPTPLVRVDRYEYAYPSIQRDPRWVTVGYRIDESPPESTEPVVVSRGWWQRLFGRRPQIPAARVMRST